MTLDADVRRGEEVSVTCATRCELEGFTMQLEMGDEQEHFVLSAIPRTCSCCLHGGPESLVAVRAKSPVKHTFEPVALSGKLPVLKDDANGLFYRLTDAVQVSN